MRSVVRVSFVPVLILVAMDQRQVWIQPGAALEGIFTRYEDADDGQRAGGAIKRHPQQRQGQDNDSDIRGMGFKAGKFSSHLVHHLCTAQEKRKPC